MANSIVIKVGGSSFVGELNDSLTGRAIYEALPIQANGQRWGGEIYFGIDVSSQAIIQNNSISNSPTAIAIRRSAPVSINYNNIENYTDHSIYLEGTSADVDATNNWWGTNDTHAINMSIHDFKFDFNLGTVTLSPIQDSPNSEIELIPEFSSWQIIPIVLAITLAGISYRKKISNKIKV